MTLTLSWWMIPAAIAVWMFFKMHDQGSGLGAAIGASFYFFGGIIFVLITIIVALI